MKNFTLKSSILLLLICLLAIGCSKSSDDFELHSDPGKNFLDVENEGYQVSLEAVSALKGQTGTWRIHSGENGRFDDENNPKSVFYGEPGEIYILGWEIREGGDYEVSEINVSFKPLQPLIYNSNVDTIHNNISVHLEAEAPKFGATGKWEIIDGDSGRIENFENSEAQFIGMEDESYMLRWTLSYGSKKESLEFSFHTDTLRAQAGVDRLDIVTSEDEAKFCKLEGFLPAGATGEWQIIKGEKGTVHSADSPSSIFQAVADSLYTLTWAVQLDDYQSIDTVQVRFRGKWGVWTDSRDGQSYRFTEINGKQWMTDNYNYIASPGAGSWYYGHAERSIIKEGYAIETEEDRKLHGRLYTWQTAIDAAPEGWRLPTSSEIFELHTTYGGAFYAGDQLVVGGDSGLELIYSGILDLQSQGDPAFRNVFDFQGISGGYWTSTYDELNNVVTFYSVDSGVSEAGGGYYNPDYTAISVRYIRDIK